MERATFLAPFSAADGIGRHPAVPVLSAVAPTPALSEVIAPRRVSMFAPPRGNPQPGVGRATVRRRRPTLCRQSSHARNSRAR
jgi:hypothetical protein